MTKLSINQYGRQLTEEQIARGEHRPFIGGNWEALGQVQFDYLLAAGLRPEHALLDVGCGALRGGVHAVRYLDPGRYHGIDINASLILAGRKELAQAGLEDKGAHLRVSDAFEFAQFGTTFDMAIAFSVFTHLPMNHIVRCLVGIREVLAEGAAFHATYFAAPHPAHLGTIPYEAGGGVSYYDQDPYHYSIDEFRFMAQIAGLDVEAHETWRHPRGQRMLSFRRAR